MHNKIQLQGFVSVVFIGMLLVIITGCGSVQHNVSLQNDYIPQLDVKIEVGTVTNETGEKFDVEAEKLLANAFAEALREENMLWTGGEGNKLILSSKIIEYKKGDALKRWLLPGWGATVLSIQCDLKNGEQLVGSANSRRSVSAGGGYTIGAWKTIFASAAKDLVKDLRKQLKK